MRVAAILYAADEGPAADALLAELAWRLRERGLKLAGAVQSNVSQPGQSRCDILLEDLASGRVVQASENRGPMASGCRLDAGALEDIVGLSSASLAPETALVIVNKFSKREAEGHGFRPLIEQAVVLGIPVLAAVKPAHLDAWTQFVGSTPALLPLDEDAVRHWCDAAIFGAASNESAAPR
ncbi:3-dehydroquinate dehydratase [Hyphomicrobium nitrativorans NL23]|uniref:3-dehydroquinate dehydratase n=1 Tax=Hyphomicrobium nitrativorans NL23 TaxID=1029756 RepID=V5SBR7_9HYPH|nr:DUF2478 domain-containing protein [Hyphomicrobium nitrativorans]AHB48316.1 3-dehydroquinate dehydratase [Hyphomicrobium nitrativorans NL23]